MHTGLHRQVSLRLALPLSTAAWQRARLLVHLPQGAYMDTYELAERHDFSPAASSSPSNAPRPKLMVAGNGFIDVELPASHSAQHAVGLEFQLPPTPTGRRMLEVRDESQQRFVVSSSIRSRPSPCLIRNSPTPTHTSRRSSPFMCATHDPLMTAPHGPTRTCSSRGPSFSCA